MSVKIFSSIEKCFLDEDFSNKQVHTEGSCLINEKYHLTIGYAIDNEFDSNNNGGNRYFNLKINSPISEYINIFKIEHVPVHTPCYLNSKDDNYLRTTPGLYPDLLLPMGDNEKLVVGSNYESLYVEINTNGEVKAGEYPIEISFINLDGTVWDSASFILDIIDAALPEQELINTRWLHCDCLCEYYKTESFDEKHWEIIENYIKTAVNRGNNMMLTPIFTPPVDTAVGGERKTVQLVRVSIDNGEYSFDFTLLDRWVELCNRLGVKYFEFSHFFTQWGAAHAPKIMATVDGVYKKIFGWETDACSKEYKKFLETFIPQLLAFMKTKNNADKRCWFHVSDEPNMEHIEQYKKSYSIVKDLLAGYPIIDALSDYEFYKKGIIKNPVPSNDHIGEFLENNVPDLWTYYCCVQTQKVSNSFIAMPSSRNRIIGLQMYKFNIKGFLHWGYNFYNTQYSYRLLNPFSHTDGENFVPSGDPFMVYPASNGTAYESLRYLVFEEALQDMRALKLCEQLYGKETVIKIIEDGINPITFDNYPTSEEWLLNVREKINMLIKKEVLNNV